MKKFLILDGNSIVNRAFYGIRPLSNRDGLPTNAIYGFLTIVKKHLDALAPDYIACAFDVHAPTFRHKAYEAYKGTRKGMPEELKVQMPYVKKVAAALGFFVIECPGYEADDIIGTSAALAAKTGGIETYILTGDRDSLQLIDDTTNVILAKTKEDIVYNTRRFIDEYGVTPKQYIDVKALMGDSSDNIPGVAGIGEKTAFKLIAAAGGLDELYAHETYFGQTASVAAKLTNGRDMAYLSRDLATICTEAPMGCMAEEIFASRPIDRAEFLSLCRELEFNGMAGRFGVDESTASQVSKREETPLSITVVNSLTELPKTDGDIAVWYEEGEFSVFLDEKAYVCNNPKENEVRDLLLSNRIVCHDLKKLLRDTHTVGCPVNCVYDTMLAAYLLNPGKGKYSLLDVAAEYLGSTIRNAADAVRCVMAVRDETEPRVTAEGMTSLMNEIEIPLSAVLAEMEEVGFKIDPDGIRAYANELMLSEEAYADAIWLQAGRPFNINSPKQLGEVLFEEIGLPAGKKTKTGYSTDAETLESLKPYHTIISDILNYRQIAKLRGTYGEPLAAQADENGRIHTKLNQTGTATGRLASSDPNLQNIPVRMEMGRELRKYFIADEGCVLIDADYSQIELRILSVLAGDETMMKAFIDGEDIHTSVAAQVFGVDVDDVTPELRRRAKAVNFGIVYGIGEFSLAKDLGITRKMAKEYIQSYLETYRGVDEYLKKTVEKAKNDGYTTTFFGRRRNIPELSSTNHNLRSFGERVAMNSPIQGTAADVIKIAMIRVNRALHDAGINARLIMQVHDELIVESEKECADLAAEILVREMEAAVQFAVTMTADCGIGNTWFDAK